MTEKRFIFSDPSEARHLSGMHDEIIKALQSEFPACRLAARGLDLFLSGPAEELSVLEQVLLQLRGLNAEKVYPTTQHVRYITKLLREGKGKILTALYADTVGISAKGRLIKPKTTGQKRYVDSIRKNAVTFGIGPAGTGKTYLAVALAAFYLKNREVERIILTRPAVEAGEKLGFLPGDMQEKIDPYLRPLYDALTDMFGFDLVQKMQVKNIIEVAPLAYMRGRTLEEAVIILDEAQNTTCEQMKMFLTRMGSHSRMVINGDITQIDLPNRHKSGLVEAIDVLTGVQGIGMMYFTDEDVVRHDMVGRIIRAYEGFYKKEEETL